MVFAITWRRGRVSKRRCRTSSSASSRHHALGLRRVRIAQHVNPIGRYDLPGEAVFVLEPAANLRLRIAACAQLFPEIVDLRLVLAAHFQRDGDMTMTNCGGRDLRTRESGRTSRTGPLTESRHVRSVRSPAVLAARRGSAGLKIAGATLLKSSPRSTHWLTLWAQPPASIKRTVLLKVPRWHDQIVWEMGSDENAG